MSRVMIVDDDRTMLSLLKILLEMEGFEVVDAPRHDAILSSVRSEKPDLVLMDVFLPGVDGMEVLSQMRASPDLAEAHVLMTSGMDLGDQCLAAGANGFLLKPYTPEQLISMIKENLGASGPNVAAGRD
jgi:two-component system response regulator MtrA